MNSAFVLGIDGLPYTLSTKLVKQGVMPNLGELMQEGDLLQMHTTVPDFSCVAWTSFSTGVNPGKHGIYGFMDFHPTTAETILPNVKDCVAPGLWHEVGNNGGRSIVLNLPGTYPALPLQGKMVSGFVAPEFDKACYPPSFQQTLRSLGYSMKLDGIGGLGQSSNVKENLWPVFEARKNTIRHMIMHEQWDLCIAVLTESDRLQHYFLHALENENHPDYEWTLNFYIELDKFIGEVAERLTGKAGLFMVSDHGFNVVKKEIIMQDFLRDLDLAPDVNEPCWESEEYCRNAKVFTMDPGRFYINRENSRFKYGFVKESEVDDILYRIETALKELTDTDNDQPVISYLKRKEEAFSGDTLDYAPDLVASTNPGYYLKSFKYGKESNIEDSTWEANHVWNDAIVYTPYKVEGNYQPMIWDVFPSVLAYMGIELPEHVDGLDLSR